MEQNEGITSCCLASHTCTGLWVMGHALSPQPQGQDVFLFGALHVGRAPGTAMPHAKGCFCPSSSQWSQRNGWGFRSSPGTPDLALPLLQAVLMAPWQFSWLALSQGLSSMGERPFRGSEAWEMFIAWPQRRWRANWERHRAKAAQAALQSQVSHSKGQSRVGEEKLLVASAGKKTLPVTAQSPAAVMVKPRDWECLHQGIPAVPCRNRGKGGWGHW